MAAKGSLSKTLVWILMGMLIVGLAGFGAINFSGSMRSVGSVGDKQISVDQYARALQQRLAQLQQQTGTQISFREAEAFGLSNQVLGQLVATRALDAEAYRIGLSVGDEQLARQLSEIGRFQGPDGTFDREAYRFAIRQAGLSEAEYEETLREESARTLLQAAIVAGNTMPSTYADTILAFAGETRDFTWIALGPDKAPADLPDPTDDELRAFYDANIDTYTTPELRQITYVSIAPEDMGDLIEVDEETLRAAYEARDAEFNVPERRLVERVVFPSDEAAAQALTRIEAGDSNFENEVTGRGLDMSDVDMGVVAQSELGDAGEAVFAAEVGEPFGPLPSEFGPALYRVNAKLPAQVTSFEDARDGLRDEQVLDRARREIARIASDVEDLLAGGATLEEVAQDTPLTLGQIDWSREAQDGIAAYAGFRDAAAAVTEEDYPEVAELEDGGIFALRLDAVLPPAPEPFVDVTDRVRDDWKADQIKAVLMTEAEALKARLDGGEALESLGQDSIIEEGLRRSDFVDGLPPSVLEGVFDMEPGDVRIAEADARAILYRLDAVHPVDREDEDVKALAEQLEQQAGSAVAEDLLQALSADIRARAGVQIDQASLNAIHAQFQ